MDKYEAESDKLDAATEKLEKQEEALREKRRKLGRKAAIEQIKRIDRVFTPRKLKPEDAKILFHPVDYLVFAGLNEGSVRSLVLLDGAKKDSELQRSIETVVAQGRYEWRTFVIHEDGSVAERD